MAILPIGCDLSMVDESMDPKWADWYDCYFGTYADDVEFFLNEGQGCSGTVLEVGCGTGRLTIPLLQSGVDVVGFDPVEKMLKRLEARASNLGLEPHVSCQGMESFRYDERFDLVIAPFRVLNHCLDSVSQRAALENVRRHLKPDGRLILATFVPDPELITSASNTVQYMSTVAHPDTGQAVVCTHFNAEIDVLNQVRTDVWVFEELDAEEHVVRKVHLPLRIRWIYPSEMPLLLELAGFNQFEAYGGFEYQPLDENSHEQIWVARSIRP